MRITALLPLDKKRYKVYLDGQFAFALYKSELLRCNISEGEEISDETVEFIKKDILTKRAKQRALYLLDRMDRTRAQLREKLKEGLYPDDVTDTVMRYLEGIGLTDDKDYARRFVEEKKASKSRSDIRHLLISKGIDGKIADEALEEEYDAQSGRAAMEKLLRKRGYDPDTAAPELRAKTYRYLFSKGFDSDEIRRAMRLTDE